MTAKKTYKKPRDKYSIEQTVLQLAPAPATTTVQTVVPASSAQGIRKVKHLMIHAAMYGDVSGTCFMWALFYLPAGMTAPAFTTSSGQPLIEPNQFVMNCGVFYSGAGPLRVSSRVARNLNSGDSIVFLVRPVGPATATTFTGIVRYAIAYK